MATITVEVDEEQRWGRAEWLILVKMRANWTCEECGVKAERDGTRSRPRLHSHHINHDPADHRLVNGRCLCVPCHSSHHRDTEEYNAFRDPEVQRALSRRAPVEAKASGGRASAAAHPGLRRELGARLVAFTTTLTADELRAKASTGWDTRREHGHGTATHCRNGHARTAENTGTQAGGYRVCLECKRANARDRRMEA